MQQLCDYVSEKSNATGCYIGQLVHKKLPIHDGSTDQDHFDENAPKVLKWTHAVNSHQTLVNRVLTADEAPITHSAFTTENECIYIPEVARASNMWFESVPRLGAYLAVPIVYDSCLTDEALTQAIFNYLEVTKLRDQQQDEIIQF